MKRLFCLFFCLQALCCAAYAQHSFNQITGTVFDEKNQPASRVFVLLKETQQIAHTDQNGQFTFDITGFGLSPNNSYGFYFVKNGYKPVEGSYRVHPFTERIILEKDYANGFHAHVSEKRGGKVFFLKGAVIAVQGGRETRTDNNGFTFVEIPKNWEEYKPIKLTCRMPYTHYDFTATINLKEIKEVFEINMSKVEDINFLSLHNKFLDRLTDLNRATLNKDKMTPEIRFIMEDFLTIDKAMRSLQGLLPDEEQKRSMYYSANNSIFGPFVLKTSRQIVSGEVERISREHEENVRNFEEMLEVLYEPGKVTLIDLPDKIDELIDLGIGIITQKLLVRIYKQDIMERIEVDTNALLDLVKYEMNTLQKYKSKMPAALIEKYQNSSNRNNEKLEDTVKKF